MSKKIKALQMEHFKNSYSTLQDRVRAWEDVEGDFKGKTLGEAARAEICKLLNISSTDEAKEMIVVAKKIKRAALVTMGPLGVYVNKFGVMSYLKPSELDKVMPDYNTLGLLSYTGIEKMILEALGAKVDGYDQGDRVYNFS